MAVKSVQENFLSAKKTHLAPLSSKPLMFASSGGVTLLLQLGYFALRTETVRVQLPLLCCAERLTSLVCQPTLVLALQTHEV